MSLSKNQLRNKKDWLPGEAVIQDGIKNRRKERASKRVEQSH
ncbi:hypothetical protein [Clostridium sp. BL-8]|nr:hypothetical protein [Clostridium sp. BL-8]